MCILKINNIKKYYGTEPNQVKAVDDISLTVNNKEFITICGTSGSGKSTLLHLIGGLDTPDSGSIRLYNKEFSLLSKEERTVFRREKIGVIFQYYNLIPMLTVRENIMLPVELDNKEVDKDYFDEIINMLSIKEKLKALPSQLSGGQQQRVAIARALIAKPAILLADEPTGNLDSKSSADVINLLLKSREIFGQTIIMITHNVQIARIADRTLYIEDGKIIGEERNRNDIFQKNYE